MLFAPHHGGMDDSSDDIAALVALVLAGGPLSPRRRLLSGLSRPADLLAGNPAKWKRAGLEDRQCKALQHPDRIRLEMARVWLAGSSRRHCLWAGHPDYPALLANSPDPPIALFLEGNLDCLLQPAIAVVGSRAASHAGRAIAADLAVQLGRHGLLVASGLAAGIDAAAHTASLDSAANGLAVIGTGPDQCYPASHRALDARLREQGLVLGEYPPGTPPIAHHFPARNRILAGLTMAVIVVEAAQRSGALLTARLAAEAGREVFAVPGSIRQPQSRGCHRLLREGAGLLESIEDLLPCLAPLARQLGINLQQRLENAPHPVEQPSAAVFQGDDRARRVLAAIEVEPVDMDELVQRTGLTVNDLSSILIGLELEGWVSCQHGRYLRSSQPTTPIASTDAGRG